MRGIHWHVWPTTMLFQVDARLGGKTGVDLGAGKNLIGAFHAPKQMVVCRSFLNTITQRQLASGCWEIFKMALIYGDCRWDESILVSRDFLESDERRLLNLGHTLGHALETKSGYQLSHGEAVGFGTLAACCLAERVGLPPFPKRLLRRIAAKLAPLISILPLWESCLDQLYLDKKCITDRTNSSKTEIYCVLPQFGAIAVQLLLPPKAWGFTYEQKWLSSLLPKRRCVRVDRQLFSL